jgi:translation initiation factor 1 (eIF-1/SUI1)
MGNVACLFLVTGQYYWFTLWIKEMTDEIKYIKEKIVQVEADLVKVQNEQDAERKRITLIDYIAYLKDELKMLEENERIRKSTQQ